VEVHVVGKDVRILSDVTHESLYSILYTTLFIQLYIAYTESSVVHVSLTATDVKLPAQPA